MHIVCFRRRRSTGASWGERPGGRGMDGCIAIIITLYNNRKNDYYYIISKIKYISITIIIILYNLYHYDYMTAGREYY